MDCCCLVLNQDGVCIKFYWISVLCKGGPECGQLDQEPDGQGASIKVGWATSHS